MDVVLLTEQVVVAAEAVREKIYCKYYLQIVQ